MRRALPVLLMLLGGCSWFGASAPAEPETPDQRECRQEARTSPGMKALDRQRMPGNAMNDDRIAQESRVVMARAYRDCLRARGLAMPGGVETPRPR